MAKHIDIVPAILPHTFAELEDGLGRAASIAPLVQIDIVDGHYAKPKSWPYRDGKNFSTIIVEQEQGLPHWAELDFEFDLMVRDPERVAMDYVRAGASRVVVHAAAPGAQKALETYTALNEREVGASVIIPGVALSVDDHPDILLPMTDQFDYVQVMGIAREGHQGEALDPRSLVLVERLRRRYPRLPIQVDGGVRLENVKQLVAAGATRLVCGSAIFGAEDPKAAYQALVAEANSA
jgi:ribulose-phosphate 3-epimerase